MMMMMTMVNVDVLMVIVFVAVVVTKTNNDSSSSTTMVRGCVNGNDVVKQTVVYRTRREFPVAKRRSNTILSFVVPPSSSPVVELVHSSIFSTRWNSSNRRTKYSTRRTGQLQLQYQKSNQQYDHNGGSSNTNKNHMNQAEAEAISSFDNDHDIIFEKQLDYDGAGTLGDIMSDSSSIDEVGGGIAKITDFTTTKNRNGAQIDKKEEEEKTDSRKKINTSPTILITTATAATTTTTTTATKIAAPPSKNNNNGLVTSIGGTLQSQFGQKISQPQLSPLERIALTANGNLQRIFSSYYDAPVHVHIDKCRRLIETHNGDGDVESKYNNENIGMKEEEAAIWDRRVNLSVFGQVRIQYYISSCSRLFSSLKLIFNGIQFSVGCFENTYIL